jgi:hypothetical protein
MLDGRVAETDQPAAAQDGGISAIHTTCGLLLLAACVLAANALSFAAASFLLNRAVASLFAAGVYRIIL